MASRWSASQRCSGSARAARSGLSDAAFVNPHCDVPRTDRPHELDVGAVGRKRVDVWDAGQVQRSKICRIRQCHNGMRVAQVKTQTGHRVVTVDLDHRIEALLAGTLGVHDAPVAEVDGDELALETDELDAPPGRDRELVSGLQALTT